MNDESKTKGQLLTEIAGLKKRISELEKVAIQRAELEKTLQESQAFLETILNNSPDIIYIYDLKEKRNIYSNNGIRNTLGYTVQEIQSMRNTLLQDLMHPDDFKTYLKSVLPRYQSAADGELIEHEYRMRHKDGSWRWLRSKESIFIRVKGSPKQIFGIVSDITERRKVEQALLKSEEKFRKAFITNPDSININRLEDGAYVQINDGFTNLTGFTEEMVLGKTSKEINIWADTDDRKKLVSRLKSKGYVKNLEARFRLANGQIKEGLMSATIIELNGMPHILSITRDISDRKQAEQALSESEKGYKELIDGMNETVWIIDFNGHIIDVNKSAVETLGYSKEEVISLGLPGIDISIKEEDIQNLARTMPSDRIQKFETTHRTKGGKVIPVEISSSIVTYKGEPSILSIARDITGRKKAEEKLRESEQRFRTIIENLTGGVFVHNIDGKLIMVNDAACKNTGWPREELLTMSVADIDPGSITRKDREKLWFEMKQGEAKSFKGTHIRKDKSQYPVEIHLSAISFEGEPMILGVAYDITDRLKAEKELTKYREYLEDMVKGRTRELEEKNEELEKFNNLFVGREFRIKELKDRIKELEAKLGPEKG